MVYQFIDESKWKEDIRAGNRTAFKYAFNFYYSKLCTYTINLTLNPEVAEDIVQEVFINFWNNRKEIHITTSLKSYLYKSCYNKYIDTYRKTKTINKKLEELRYIEIQRLTEEDTSIRNYQIELLNKAIEELPEKCREIFILSKLEGLKYKEIAEKLGISIKTVENQIGTAFMKLRKAKGSF